jgi:type VI secretion system secreted protein VgrG
MSLKGLRFTLEVDGLPETATAVVSFTLYQNLSIPFSLSVDIAGDQPDLSAADFLEKQRHPHRLAGHRSTTLPPRYHHRNADRGKQ